MQRGFLWVSLALICAASARANASPENEGAGSANDSMTEQARSLHIAGDKYYEDHDYERAHAAYLAAWALKEHWQIAGNLGDSELQLGRYLEAARHLDIYLRTAPQDHPKVDRGHAATLMAEARKYVGALRVKVASARAEIFVEGRYEGQADQNRLMFVSPGRRYVEARDGQAVGYVFVDVSAGETKDVSVPLSMPKASAGTDVPERHDAAPIWVLAGSSLLLLGGGGVSLWYSRQRASDADEIREGIPKDQPRSVCSTNAPYAYQSACADFRSASAEATQLRNLAMVGFVGGGALALGVAASFLVGAMAPRSKGLAQTVGIMPLPSGAAISWTGSF